MAMYTKSLNGLKLTLQCIRDIFSIAQSESNYELLDMALQTHGVLLQQRHCGVGVLRRNLPAMSTSQGSAAQTGAPQYIGLLKPHSYLPSEWKSGRILVETG